MSAVLLAIFPDYATADRVRMELFHEGFPTDRIELTAACEPGRAAIHAADSMHVQFVRYFASLLNTSDERHYVEEFAHELDDGAAAITVHPRGSVETVRATEILDSAHPKDIARHDVSNQPFEYAAARTPKPWLTHFWVENHSNAHCIYCQMFERDLQG